MADFSSYKVPVFPNINDAPSEPTATKAGNGSDLINRFNGLIDELQTIIDELQDNMPSTSNTLNWTIETDSNPDIAKLEVFYSDVSEYWAYQTMNLITKDPAYSWVAGTDFNPGDSLNISSVIDTYNCGFYTFLYTMTDGSIKNDTLCFPTEDNVLKGLTRQAVNSFLLTIYYNDGNVADINNVRSLIVVYPNKSLKLKALCGIPEIG